MDKRNRGEIIIGVSHPTIATRTVIRNYRTEFELCAYCTSLQCTVNARDYTMLAGGGGIINKKEGKENKRMDGWIVSLLKPRVSSECMYTYKYTALRKRLTQWMGGWVEGGVT